MTLSVRGGEGRGGEGRDGEQICSSTYHRVYGRPSSWQQTPQLQVQCPYPLMLQESSFTLPSKYRRGPIRLSYLQATSDYTCMPYVFSICGRNHTLFQSKWVNSISYISRMLY